MAVPVDIIDPEKIKEYAANSGKIASAIEALKKHDGWQIFLALYKRKKDSILKKREYKHTPEGLIEFGSDRGALDIIDELFDEMDGFVADAEEAAETLAGISPEPEKDRGIMLIEATEQSNRESA